MNLGYSLARTLTSIAESHAERVGVPMAVAVADGRGSLLCFARMDDALPAATQIAMAKAYTAAVLRLPTHEIGRLAQPGGELYGIQHAGEGRIVLFGGGLPLAIDDCVVGAVGVSGGTVDQDLAVARPVVEAFREMQAWAARLVSLLPAEPEIGRFLRTGKSRILSALSRLDGMDEGTAVVVAGALFLLADGMVAGETSSRSASNGHGMGKPACSLSD